MACRPSCWGAGVRLAKVATLTVEHVQQCAGRWVIVDLYCRHLLLLANNSFVAA